MILSANPKDKIGKGEVISPMYTPAIKSGIFHILIVGALTVGLPFVKKDPVAISPPIAVEIVDVSELTTTPKIAPPVKPKEKEKPPEPQQKKEAAPKVTSEKPPDLTKPKPPEVDTAEDTPDVPPPEPLKRAEIKEPKPKPKPEVTKKPKPKPKEDDFQSLLKNIIPDEPEESQGDEKPLDPDSTPDDGQIAKLADQLTMSEQDALKHQLAGCWYVQAGAKYAEELIVEIRVEMNRDRTVKRASILKGKHYNQDSHYQAAARAALRALENPKCSPLKLPPEKYDEWKTVLIRFDPRDML